jgi:alkaline phosphatase D
MPLRRSSVHLDTEGKVQNIDLYRQISYGALAQFLVLDLRQYRTEQPCGDQGSLVENSCKERLQDPILRNNKPYRRHTILGTIGDKGSTPGGTQDKQESWLKANLNSSGPTWDVLAQQTIMFQYNHRDWSGNWYSEAWDS